MKHFAHLHCHSHFSFHAGTASPDELVALAAYHEMPALALTDHHGLYGAVLFYKKAIETGIKPIIGIDMRTINTRKTFTSNVNASRVESQESSVIGSRCAPRLSRSPAPPLPGSPAPPLSSSSTLDPRRSTLDALVLAKDYYGYSQLCKLTTELQLNSEFSFVNCLKKHYADGKAKDNECHFIVLTSEPETAKALSSFLDAHHLYIEINPSMKQSVTRVHLAESLKRKAVITGNVYFAAPQDYETHRILRAIGELKTINNRSFDFIAPRSSFFMKPEGLQSLFSMCPGACNSTQEIIDRCNIKLPIKEYKFPTYTVPPGETSYSYLWKICFKGAIQRYGTLSRAVMERLSMELQVIERLGFADYFLLVWDVVHYAKEKGIPSIGRGSAANSIVSYVLEITHVEPTGNNLYFERFLNSERKSPPDIDVDFCWRRRDDILKYVYEKYGNDRVAMISTYVRFSARSLFREIGKAMGVPEQELNKFTARLPHFFHGNRIEEAIEKIPECRTLPLKEEPFSSIFEYAQKLNGAPQHLSIHAGGIVVSPTTITDYVALERASKGLVITQYDMFSMEDMGLVKIDLLSQRSLSVYADTKIAVEKAYRVSLPEDMETYYNDGATKALIRDGNTIGCFYIESPAMRQLLKKLKVDTFPMLTAASSVIRPGVAESGMMQQYIRRHHHMEPVSYLHPRMEEILYETYGVMIYQEDVIRVAHKIIGLSLQEADLLRRAMSGKERSHDVMQKLETQFIEKALSNGITKDIAGEIWRQISSFAGYAFCKAHSASYAQLSFRVAYLKAHYPAEFMAAVLSNQGGFYHPSVYVSEARALGLHILLPDINHSDHQYNAEGWRLKIGERGSGGNGERESRSLNAIRIGFVQVKHLTGKTIDLILNNRKNGYYTSLEDFLLRVNVSYSEAEILIKIGALDSLSPPHSVFPSSRPPVFSSPAPPLSRSPTPPLSDTPAPFTRPQLLWKLKSLYPLIQKWKLKKNSALDDKCFPSVPVPVLSEYSLEQKLTIEEEYLDMPVSAHPLARYRELIKKYNVVPSRNFVSHIGKTVNALGWLVALKRISTSKGDYMLFISFEDLSGFYEITLFPRAYSRYGSCLTNRGPYLVTGRIIDDFGCVSITTDRIQHV